MMNRRLVALIIILLIIGIAYYILNRQSEKYEPTAEEIKDVETEFRKMDTDKNGEVTKSEFEESINMSTKFGLNTDNIKPEMFEIIDTDGDGIIKLEELLNVLKNKTNTSTEGGLDYMFSIMDKDKNNKVTKTEFENGISTLSSMGFNDNSIKPELFTLFDKDNDDAITLEELLGATKVDSEVTKQQGAEMIFRIIDTDNNDNVSEAEYMKGDVELEKLGIDASVIKLVEFKQIDQNNDNNITLEEMIKAIKLDEETAQKKGTEYIFRVMDVDENKKLTQKEFDEGIDVLSGIGTDTSDIKPTDFTRFDFNDDNAVTLEEMLHFIEVNQSSN